MQSPIFIFLLVPVLYMSNILQKLSYECFRVPWPWLNSTNIVIDYLVLALWLF